MNHSWSLILGVVATVMFSMMGLVLIPNWQFQEMKPVVDSEGYQHPTEPLGTVALGRKVYIDLGCLYCHSQQVRAADFGSDIARGWGTRRSVTRDYSWDAPPLLGTMRTGPDLTNIGARQPSRNWHYLHLYNPQITSPGSVMPRFPFLFRVRQMDKHDTLPADAIVLPKGWAASPTYIAPNERALNLVDYLRSLDHSYDLPEAGQ
jgi:cytochrome c oxidase cbb3-type subunit 2